MSRIATFGTKTVSFQSIYDRVAHFFVYDTTRPDQRVRLSVELGPAGAWDFVIRVIGEDREPTAEERQAIKNYYILMSEERRVEQEKTKCHA